MYFTIQITRKNENVAKQIFDFSTLREAKANHYYFMASSSADADVDYILGEIVDDSGIVISSDIYKESADER